MKAYPKTLFVKWEDGGNGPDYLNPVTDVADLAQIGIKTKVGVYRLVETQDVKGMAIISGQKKRRS